MPTKALSDIKNTVLLGGFATGCMKLKDDMSNEFSGLVKSSVKEYTDKTPTNKNALAFIAGVKLDGEEKFKGAVLGSYDKAVPALKVSEFNKEFPFTQIGFSGKKIKDVDISLAAFNPCIVHNPIDSAIPAAEVLRLISMNLSTTKAAVCVNIIMIYHIFHVCCRKLKRILRFSSVLIPTAKCCSFTRENSWAKFILFP